VLGVLLMAPGMLVVAPGIRGIAEGMLCWAAPGVAFGIPILPCCPMMLPAPLPIVD